MRTREFHQFFREPTVGHEAKRKRDPLSRATDPEDVRRGKRSGTIFVM
ncbi:hypothetical protein BJ982_002668 [Sphaerisporangium siamense]|uniref:Uncharacterized protein n=1 Tax=Sphaerisporangium siamense TaxID=795645 RepID=A0A7W7GA51_9ACTN|nr:hypothetical protein [Sphaerisporangium siamense]